MSTACSDEEFFDCGVNKPTEEAFRELFTRNSNGCTAIRVTGIELSADTINVGLDDLEALVGLTNSILTGAFGSGSHTLTSTAVVASGSVAAGARSVSISLSSDFSGSINGVARTYPYIFQVSADPGKTLPAIPYVRSAGTLTIDVLT